MPRELILSPRHDVVRSLGWFMTAWVEHWCVHGPGDVEGDPVILDDEIAEFLVNAYALDDTGRRLYSNVVLSRAKGRSKSEIAGFTVLFEAFAPCRGSGEFAKGGEQFLQKDFKYTFEPGEPLPMFIRYPFIRCMSTEEEQSGNTYDNVYFNLTQGPLGEDLPSNTAGLTRTFIPGGGEIRPSTAGSASKDGGKESFVVYDETHLYVLPELHRMYRTVSRNLTKRRTAEPWAFQTTTMYQPGEDSVAEKTHERAKLILEGRARSAGLMFDHVEMPPDVDLTSRRELKAALCEVYGPFAEVMDLDRIIEEEFWNPEKDVEESRRYFGNQPTAARDAWITAEQWSAIEDCDRKIDADAPQVMFFDGSKSLDATGLVGCDMEHGHLMTFGLWERPAGSLGEGWEVDREDVDAVVHKVMRERNIVAFFADVREFESYIDEWGEEFSKQLVIPATVGRYQHNVAWDMRGRVKEFTEAVERMYVDIEQKTVTHDGDTRLRRHFLNARRRMNKYGVSISKTARNSPNKIDLAVCGIGARMVRRMVMASPYWQKRDEVKGKRPGRARGWS